MSGRFYGCFPRIWAAQSLRSDSGPPFASCGAGGLSKLSVKVIKAGVVPERIAPGKPQQNGRLERLHLTLLQDTADPPARSLRQQMQRFRTFQRLYNEERPHQALGNDTPADHYGPSVRQWDGVLREPEYHLDAEIRRVRHNGEIKWQGNTIYITTALIGEPIGLVEDANGAWTAPLDRSCSASSLMAVTDSANLNSRPVDMWTTQARCPQVPPAQQQQQQS